MHDSIGRTVTDKITGFSGVVIGRVEYLTGCNQLLVTPKVDKDGRRIDSEWFDESRVAFSEGTTKLSLQIEDAGFCESAPRM